MTTPTRAPLMPEPFGYVSDGFPDGLHFQHKPWPELHQLTHSVAAVYSAAQLVQAIEDAKAAGREQGLREAKEVCEAIDPRASSNPAMLCAMNIEQLRANPEFTGPGRGPRAT